MNEVIIQNNETPDHRLARLRKNKLCRKIIQALKDKKIGGKLHVIYVEYEDHLRVITTFVSKRRK
ncbi:MAG: hypothetical protein HY929_02290 [Euryarchaeota archaeon]|nr:hypothetical protein [Euryarchaeota archaeon]